VCTALHTPGSALRAFAKRALDARGPNPTRRGWSRSCFDEGMRIALVTALSFVLAACGGRIDSVELAVGNAQAESSVPGVPSAPATCGAPDDGRVLGPGNACEWAQTWASGGVTYGVDCTCPIGKCTCTEQTGASATPTTTT
jgi:hypothetical protein